MIYANFYESPYGKMCIAEEDGKLTHVSFDGRGMPKEYEVKETDIIKKAYSQLTEYFEGKRTSFELALAPKGTAFERAVWDALLTIPYGQTCSYKHIAAIVGNEKASRAVGRANGLNPITIIVPCHRVIGAGGTLVGYGGGLDMKRTLLEHESALRP